MAEKKEAIIRILQILQKYTDAEHPLTAPKISEILQNEYCLSMERKAINENIHILESMGYDIEHVEQQGYYYISEFSDSELRLLIDSVLSSKHISASGAIEMIKKIRGLSNQFFAGQVNQIHAVKDFDRTENRQLFDSIDQITEAIKRGRQIQFNYNKYGPDKKLSRSRTHRVSPYTMILHNQRYYLMAYEEDWGKNNTIVYLRLDRMTDMAILDDKLTPYRSLPGCGGGINYKELSTERPYMYGDTIERVDFIADEAVLDHIVDWFGKDFTISPYGTKKYKVSLRVSPMAMEYWALQYVNHVKVLSPQKLVDKIKADLENGLKKY